MIREYPNEEWREIQVSDYEPKKSRVFISNYGRVKKKSSRSKEFKLSKTPIVNGFIMCAYPRKDNPTQGRFYIHRMVATCFLDTPKEDETCVIHLDHNLKNNYVKNLKYVTQADRTKHLWTNPKFVESRKNWQPNVKLSEAKVRYIKKKVLSPNRKTKMHLMAKQFGISLSQLRRIQSGEHWKHIEV